MGNNNFASENRNAGMTQILFQLFNPSFCSLILSASVHEYEMKRSEGMPISLVYLILPIVFDPSIRDRLPTRENMISWVYGHQDVLVSFPRHCHSLIDIGSQAIEFSLQRGLLQLAQDRFTCMNFPTKSLVNNYLAQDQEIESCYEAARLVGRWFAKSNPKEVYLLWRIKP